MYTVAFTSTGLFYVNQPIGGRVADFLSLPCFSIVNRNRGTNLFRGKAEKKKERNEDRKERDLSRGCARVDQTAGPSSVGRDD